MEILHIATLNDEQKKRIFNRNSRKTSVLVEDIAHTVKFLLSDESKWITGQVINVDGGIGSLKIN